MLTRRSFLRAFGIGTAAAAVAPELIVEPVRRIWQVPRSAPVGGLWEPPGPRLYSMLGVNLDASTYAQWKDARYDSDDAHGAGKLTYDGIAESLMRQSERERELRLLYGSWSDNPGPWKELHHRAGFINPQTGEVISYVRAIEMNVVPRVATYTIAAVDGNRGVITIDWS